MNNEKNLVRIFPSKDCDLKPLRRGCGFTPVNNIRMILSNFLAEIGVYLSLLPPTHSAIVSKDFFDGQRLPSIRPAT